MNPLPTYFFCGIGGSGMSPLAQMFKLRGHGIVGSDRSRDQGKTPEKFKALESAGIRLFPQDGSGVTKDIGALVISSAVEDMIPDVSRAKELGIPVRKRADILAGLFHDYKTGIAVAGTSGKSTVTGMIATIFEQQKQDPVVMNGGIIRNFGAAFRPGQGDVFIAEVDESDASIGLFNPSIAVLNNIALDHKSLEEIGALFSDFIGRAKKAVVLNFDDPRVKALAGKIDAAVFSYAIEDKTANLRARDIKFLPDGVTFIAETSKESVPVRLKVPGQHNVSNALAALAAAQAAGIALKDSAKALEKFTGIQRRLEVTGTKNNITVIDDFAHNPDKIAASLKTLKEFPGRLIVMFQPHGYGPLKLMGRAIGESFAANLGPGDMLLMPEAYFAGGTVDKSVTSKDIVNLLKEKKVDAHWFETRDKTLLFIIAQAKAGDRIIIMGARDDTLSEFARQILKGL